MAKNVLNLSGNRKKAAESSSSSSGSESDEAPRKQVATQGGESSGTEESDAESDEEFEIPPGFDSVQGSSTITRESVLSSDQELWFFKLPKNLDASALANVSFKIAKEATTAGTVITSVHYDAKSYNLQEEDAMLTSQLVNAFPMAKERKKFALGKPFTRTFSLVDDRSKELLQPKKRTASESETADQQPESAKKTKLSKSKNDAPDSSSKPAKKAKAKK